MSTQKQYSGTSGSPIPLRTNAPRQTEEARYRQTTRKPIEADDNPAAWTIERTPNSAVRYNNPRRRETANLPDPKKTRVMRRQFDRTTFVIWLCIGLIVMIVGWWLLSWLANWWQGVQDNMKYGNPRTFQADQYVNLGDSPNHPDHFIALNLHGVIEVVQINPLNSKLDAVYVLTSVENESIPATLSFRDTSGSGKIDVIVTIGDSNPYTLVMLNNGKTLVPTQAAH
jgi:hypothetical protein